MHKTDRRRGHERPRVIGQKQYIYNNIGQKQYTVELLHLCCLFGVLDSREPVENKGSKQRNDYALECGPQWTSCDWTQRRLVWFQTLPLSLVTKMFSTRTRLRGGWIMEA